jgi:serine/threonine protein kinase
LVFKTITIKLFNLTKILSKRQNELYDILLLNECPNLETIYLAFCVEDSDLYFVISKTIDTSFKSSKDTISSASHLIRESTLNALRYLSFHGWNHRDVSIDNLGLNTETNNFVLFDFGSAKNNRDHEDHDKIFSMDMTSLNKSILFHTTD